MVKSLESFKVANSNYEFRFKKIAIEELLALAMITGDLTFTSNKAVVDFTLKNTETFIEGKWTTIKMGQVIFPSKLEDEPNVLMNIVMKFITEFISPLFQKSAE